MAWNHDTDGLAKIGDPPVCPFIVSLGFRGARRLAFAELRTLKAADLFAGWLGGM
jgi:hypothetical protein